MALDINKTLAKFVSIQMEAAGMDTETEEYFKAEQRYFENLRDTLSSFAKPLAEIEKWREEIHKKYRKKPYIPIRRVHAASVTPVRNYGFWCVIHTGTSIQLFNQTAYLAVAVCNRCICTGFFVWVNSNHVYPGA